MIVLTQKITIFLNKDTFVIWILPLKLARVDEEIQVNCKSLFKQLMLSFPLKYKPQNLQEGPLHLSKHI